MSHEHDDAAYSYDGTNSTHDYGPGFGYGVGFSKHFNYTQFVRDQNIRDDQDFSNFYGDDDEPSKKSWWPWSSSHNDSYDYFDERDKKADFVWYLLAGILLLIVLQFLLPCWHDCREKLARRKRAAHYRKVGASAELATAEEDVGILEAAFFRDEGVECFIDLSDGTSTRTCEAYVGELEKISELPFILTEACKASSNPALQSVSIVDLFLKGGVKLQYTNESDVLMDIGKAGQTTPAQLRAAKSFRVTVLKN